MVRGLLDTTVLVGVLRRQAPALEWLRHRPKDWSGCVSVISVFELLSGCQRPSEQRGMESRLSEFTVVGLNEPISALALRWYKSLRFKHGVGFLDCLIGATAKQHNLEVFTHNKKHFSPMPGLHVIVPY